MLHLAYQVIKDITCSEFAFWGSSGLQLISEDCLESAPPSQLQIRNASCLGQPRVANPSKAWTKAINVVDDDVITLPSQEPHLNNNNNDMDHNPFACHLGCRSGGPVARGASREQARRRPDDINVERQMWKSIEPFLESLQVARVFL